MLEDYPNLYKIFNPNKWNGKVEHPLVNIMSESENPKYEIGYQNYLKFHLCSLNTNLRKVSDYLDGKNNGSTKRHDLEGKMKEADRFYETIVEITWFAKWISKGILVDIEPLGKNKVGPDAKLKINGKDVFCEVTTRRISKGMKRLSDMENTIVKNISEIEPKYSIDITTCRKLTDDDIKGISEFIKKEIVKNDGEKHFKTYYNDIFLYFSDSFQHYVKIHPSPSLEEIYKPTRDYKDPFRTKILEKIKQLKKVGNYPKVIILDYGGYLDGYGLDYWNIDSFIQSILGETMWLSNHIYEFSSPDLKDLSGLIILPHITDQNYPPTCYINDCADCTINEKEIKKIACIC